MLKKKLTIAQRLQMLFWSDERLFNFWKKEVYAAAGRKPKPVTSAMNGRMHKAKPKGAKQYEMF